MTAYENCAYLDPKLSHSEVNYNKECWYNRL